MDPAKTISIFSVCDNHYVILLAAMIKSVEINHHGSEHIEFYIVEDNIRKENRKKLTESFNSSKLTLKWLKIDEIIPKNVTLPLDNTSFPLNIYARLFIPEIVPELKRILYLDVDMIVLRDIAELWHQDLEGYTIGAVIDRPGLVSNDWGAIVNYQELGLPADAKYFNSGLLLIDTKKWLQENVADRVINTVANNLEYANYPDQYGLNVVFAEKWKEFDPRWNCHSTSSEPDPFIIHFSGRKPIYRTYNNNEAYRLEFEKYSAMTQWKGKNRKSEVRRLLKKLYNKMEKYMSLSFQNQA